MRLETEARYVDNYFSADGGIFITFEIPLKSRNNALLFLDEVNINKDKKLSLTVKEWRNKRSLDANSYLWVLCTALSEKLKIPKEEIYKEHIRQMGIYEPLALLEKAVERFCTAWSERGIGWFCEVVDSDLKGCKKVFAYYGSSTYDTKEMSLLIDNIVLECKEQGIETLPPDELEAMKNAWK